MNQYTITDISELDGIYDIKCMNGGKLKFADIEKNGPEALRDELICKPLGEGNFGVVFKVIHKTSQKPSAVKVLNIGRENTQP